MIRLCAVLSCAALFAACSSSSPAPFACKAPSNICQPATGATFCANLATETANCGACGNVCPVPGNGGTTSCVAGVCQPSCGGGTKALCNAAGTSTAGLPTLSCTDTATDPDNCGACGTICPANEVCQAGACKATGMTECGGPTGGVTFKDLQTDRNNCGACNNICGSTEVCSAGDCTPCPVSQCGNVCTDTLWDPKNCGACGTAVNLCENGVAVSTGNGTSKLFIELGAPATSGFLPASSSNFTQTVQVHSQYRVQSVTVSVNNGPVTFMNLSSTFDTSPTTWSTTLTVPASGANATLSFIAQDAFYLPSRADAADHTTTLTTSALIFLGVPTAAPTAFTATVGGASINGQFVPLNAGPITFTATVPASQNIAAVSFESDITGNPVAVVPVVNGTATKQFLPTELPTGVSERFLACSVDAAGQTVVDPTHCSAVITTTLGSLPNSSPVLGKGADGTHSIYYLDNNGGLFTLPFDQLSGNPTAPGTSYAGDKFIQGSLHATPDGAGAVAIKQGGTALERFDITGGALSVSATYVVPPAAKTFNQVIALTGAAVLLQDKNSGDGFFAQAKTGQTTDTAIAMGQILTNLSSGQPVTQTTMTGAIVSWFKAADGTTAPWMFHPALAGNRSLVLATPAVNQGGEDMQIFPSGEILLGIKGPTGPLMAAAFFDGTNAPKLLLQFAVGTNQPSFFSESFVEAKPGVVLGVVADATTNQNTAAEFVLNGATPTVFYPAPYVAATTGPIVTRAVTDRYGNSTTFAVSDDATKAIFVTQDPVTGGGSIQTIHLLDLATGTSVIVGASELLGNGGNSPPHFVHSLAGYLGGAATGAIPAIVWSESFSFGGKASGLGNYTDERLNLATWAGNTVNKASVSQLTVGYSSNGPTLLPTAESAAGQQLLFLSPGQSGGYNLYTVPLTTPAGSLLNGSLVADNVTWFTVREDKSRLLVLRSDGTLLSGTLAPGVNPGTTLQPIATGGYGGQANLLLGTNSFGFTPDGNSAFNFANTELDLAGTSAFLGTLETIELTTLHRTNLGRAAFGFFGSTAPAGFFGGSGAGGVVIDPLSDTGGSLRIAVAPTAAPTLHQDPGFGQVNLRGGANQEGALYSVDLNEFDFQVRVNSNQLHAIFEKDGTLLGSYVIGNCCKQAPSGYSQQATNLPPPSSGTFSFGGPFTDEFDVFSVGTGGTFFKVWGGPTPQPLFRISVVNAFNSLAGTAFTADHKELHYSFIEGGAGFVIELGLSGRAPPPYLAP